MYQQEIQFFWPLTEQIPLDLDYSECARPKLTTSTASLSAWPSGSIVTTAAPQWTTTYNIDTAYLKFTLNKKPGIIRKLAYKILGIKWGIN